MSQQPIGNRRSEAANGDLLVNWQAVQTNEIFQVQGLTFSVIYFIYLSSRSASGMVIKKGSGQF